MTKYEQQNRNHEPVCEKRITLSHQIVPVKLLRELKQIFIPSKRW